MGAVGEVGEAWDGDELEVEESQISVVACGGGAWSSETVEATDRTSFSVGYALRAFWNLLRRER